MNGSSLIFVILICVWVHNLISKAKSGTKDRAEQKRGNVTDAGRDAGRQSAFYGDPTSVSAHSAQKAVQTGETAAKGRTMPGHSRTAGTAAQKAVRCESAAKPEEVSTTEYLRQKALEDQKEHEREARQEAARLQRESGGRRAARRHYDGDSIPQGMRLVKCGYCGAENLIGNGQNQKNFTCYFCREGL